MQHPYLMIAMMEGYILKISWHPGKMSLSIRCKNVKKMVDFVVSTLVGCYHISPVFKHGTTNMVGSCTKNIMMDHFRYMTGTTVSVCVIWNLWLKLDIFHA